MPIRYLRGVPTRAEFGGGHGQDVIVDSETGKLYGLIAGAVSELGSPSGPGGDLSDGDYGDITVSGSGSVLTIDAGVVTTSKLGGDITPAGKALLDDADNTAQRATLGLGSAATQESSAFEPAGVAAADITDSTATGRALMTATDAAAARSAIGAGTSNFSGAYTDLTGKPSSFTPSLSRLFLVMGS